MSNRGTIERFVWPSLEFLCNKCPRYWQPVQLSLFW